MLAAMMATMMTTMSQTMSGVPPVRWTPAVVGVASNRR
jgi:hypothetical protein